VVEEASRQAAVSTASLAEALSMDPAIVDVLPKLPGDVFDPGGWLGSSELFVDRALQLYRQTYGHD
jgi:hypothetical protein